MAILFLPLPLGRDSICFHNSPTSWETINQKDSFVGDLGFLWGRGQAIKTLDLKKDSAEFVLKTFDIRVGGVLSV